MKVIILKGLPASGKSTFAKELVDKDQSWVRVNKDSFRDMLFNGQFNKDKERLVYKCMLSTFRNALEMDYNVIVDNTHLSPGAIEALVDVCDEYDAAWTIHEFTVPVEECIRRDALRIFPVGETVIRNMYEKLIKGKS